MRLHLSLCAFSQERNGILYFGFYPSENEFCSGGNFVALKLTQDSFRLRNDVFGGYRIYWWEQQGDIFVTNDVFAFLTEEELAQKPKEDYECRYFAKHGYTSGDMTCYAGIRKLPPCSSLHIDRHGVRVVSEWPLSKIDRKPNEKLFREAIIKAVDNSLTPLAETNRPVVLCYSGGVDSNYLANRLIALGVKFDLVFFKDSTARINRRELRKALKGAATLGKTLYTQDITCCKDDRIESILAHMRLFDNHYGRYHFYGLKGIVEKWGAEVLLVNGQNSDSILSFGPSERKFTSFLKRFLLYGRSRIFKRLIAQIISRAFQYKLSVPENEEELRRAFYDNFKYCLLTDETDHSGYKDYLNNKIAKIRSEMPFSTDNNLRMYLKLYTHIQASDTQIVTQSARYNGVDVLLPFSSMAVMEAALRYKDDRIELYRPKYALRNK